MKNYLLLLLMVSFATAQGQTLKEALFSGKLKNEAGSVIRKGDDLKSKMDSTRKEGTTAGVKKDSVMPLASRPAEAKKDSAATNANIATEQKSEAEVVTNASENPPAAVQPTTAAAAKDNNAVWKEFMEGFIAALKADVLPLKKIKKGEYFISVFYSIQTDGRVELTEVLVSPESKELQEQIIKRLQVDAPQLRPVVAGNGQPRKVSRKYNFTLVKE